jgi:hypothetical protein
MNGQGHDRSPEVAESASTGGEDHRREPDLSSEPSGSGLAVLSREPLAVRREDVEVVVDPALFADLHDPSLVITRGYVGPERRRAPRLVPEARRRPSWLRHVWNVLFLTFVVVVPLTMIAARSVPPSTTDPSPAQAQGKQGPGKVSTRSPSRAATHPRVFTASPDEVARAEAAYQRALARVEGTGGGSSAGAVPSTGPAPATGDLGVVGANGASAAAAAPAVTGASRADAQAQAAASRAQAQADAAARRSAQAASRAAAQAARAAARAAIPTSGGVSGAAPGGVSGAGTTSSGS